MHRTRSRQRTKILNRELLTMSQSQCTCCQEDISGLGLECLDCHNGSLRLCGKCHILGAEPGQHKSEHQCRFFDSGSLTLPQPSLQDANTSNTNRTDGEKSSKWSALEEIKLLNAMDRHGIGNWQAISKQIKTKKPAEVKTFYENRYVSGTIGQLTWPDTIPNGASKSMGNGETQKPVPGPSSSLTQRPPVESTPEEMLKLAYMPKRDEYETEHDDEAEKLVSKIYFNPDDTEIEVELKLAVVDMYARRLKERERRKEVVKDYQLMEKFFKDKARNDGNETIESLAKGTGKDRSASLKSRLEKTLRPFSQFTNRRESEHLLRNMVKEEELKDHLTKLYKYRRNGIRRLEECSEFEDFKAKDDGFKGIRLRKLETITEPDDEEEDDTIEAKGGKLRQTQQTLSSNSQKNKLAGMNLTNNPTNSINVGESPSAARNQRQCFKNARGLTPSIITSASLLTSREFELCMKTCLSPAQFLTVKTALLLARKPKTDSQHVVEMKEVPRPPNIEPEEWELLTTFFKCNYC